jgi:hypothetical protein
VQMQGNEHSTGVGFRTWPRLPDLAGLFSKLIFRCGDFSRFSTLCENEAGSANVTSQAIAWGRAKMSMEKAKGPCNTDRAMFARSASFRMKES